MNYAPILTLVGLLALSPVAHAQASFDCYKATRAIDSFICTYGPLSSADRAMGERYKAALAAAPDETTRTAPRPATKLGEAT